MPTWPPVQKRCKVDPAELQVRGLGELPPDRRTQTDQTDGRASGLSVNNASQMPTETTANTEV